MPSGRSLIVELCYKTMRFRIINDDEIGSERRVATCFIQRSSNPDGVNGVNVNRAISDDVNRDLGAGCTQVSRHTSRLRGQPKARCT